MNVHRGALLLVPQWRCISSFVFYIGQAFLSYSLHKVWDTNMTFDLKLWPINLNINRHQIITKDYLYQVWSFWDKEFLSYPFRKVWDTNMTFDLDLMAWISLRTLNIASRTIYLPLFKLLKQTVHRTYWVIFCTMLRVYGHAGIHTCRPTYQPTDKNVQSSMPSFS